MGQSANILAPNVGDANTMIPEFKAFLCDIRRAGGSTAFWNSWSALTSQRGAKCKEHSEVDTKMASRDELVMFGYLHGAGTHLPEDYRILTASKH